MLEHDCSKLQARYVALMAGLRSFSTRLVGLGGGLGLRLEPRSTGASLEEAAKHRLDERGKEDARAADNY